MGYTDWEKNELSRIAQQVAYFYGTPGARRLEPGTFYTHLYRAFIHADRDNFLRLSQAYPYVGKVFQRAKYGELGGVDEYVRWSNGDFGE